MTDRDRPKVLTDEQWEVLAPLIEASRPPYKTEHHDLRRTIEAIIWRHDSGAKWRQISAELGSWWMAAQTFGRWCPLSRLDLCQPQPRRTPLVQTERVAGGCDPLREDRLFSR